MDASRSVFLSYRRELGFAWTKLLWLGLEKAEIDAFFDLEDLNVAGTFDTRIFTQIEARPYFVPVLTVGSLHRCDDPEDWLRRELEHAVLTERTIVPFTIQGFDFKEARDHLPAATAQALSMASGVPVVLEYFDEAVARLVNHRLQPKPDYVVPLSPEDRAFAEAARRRVEEATPPTPVPPPPSPMPPPVTPVPPKPGPVPPPPPWWRSRAASTDRRRPCGPRGRWRRRLVGESLRWRLHRFRIRWQHSAGDEH